MSAKAMFPCPECQKRFTRSVRAILAPLMLHADCHLRKISSDTYAAVNRGHHEYRKDTHVSQVTPRLLLLSAIDAVEPLLEATCENGMHKDVLVDFIVDDHVLQ